MPELVKKAMLTFNPSGSPDIAGYFLYLQDADNGLVTRATAAAKVDLGNPALDENGLISIDLTTIPELATENNYSLGIASYDAAGNESALLTAGLEEVNLDFTAPDPPTNASISYV
jgi:hypothetical protein